MEVTPLVVPGSADGTRLDVFLLQHVLGNMTRSLIQRAIRDGRVSIAGKHVIKPSTAVHGGQTIIIDAAAFSGSPHAENPPAYELPELRILHEDPQVLVLNKPAGVPVHRGVKIEPTIADALIARYPDLKNVGDPIPAGGLPAMLRVAMRAGIVHRLDKDTSGVLLVARTPEMYEYLKRQFQRRAVRKEYLALVHGVVSENGGSIKLPLIRSKRNPLRRAIARPGEGKEAETTFRALERFREHTLLVVSPRTGRMHQIRVHLAHLGFPVAGDPLYGRKSRHRTPPGLKRQFLHARSLSVVLPSGKTQTFESPLPDDLANVIATLRPKPQAPSPKPLGYRWRTPRGATN